VIPGLDRPRSTSKPTRCTRPCIRTEFLSLHFVPSRIIQRPAPTGARAGRSHAIAQPRSELREERPDCRSGKWRRLMHAVEGESVDRNQCLAVAGKTGSRSPMGLALAVRLLAVRAPTDTSVLALALTRRIWLVPSLASRRQTVPAGTATVVTRPAPSASLLVRRGRSLCIHASLRSFGHFECVDGATCDGNRSICVVPIALAAACRAEGDPCVATAYCSGEGSCVNKKATGEACASDLECVAPHIRKPRKSRCAKPGP
jgi:hypothetical protein